MTNLLEIPPADNDGDETNQPATWKAAIQKYLIY